MDKELALILAEMLIKQDENTAEIKESNSILREFMGVSVKQWEQQHIFNEVMLNEVRGIKEVISNYVQLEARLKAIENNFELRISNLEKLSKAS